MNENAKIIILRGNSGSRKTTVAKKLQRCLGGGTFVISQDVVRREMLMVKDGPENKAISLLIEMVKFGKGNCKYVILEGILNSDWYAELFKTVVAEYGSNNIYAYYYELPFEETLRRHQTKSCSNEFGEEPMRRWWREKDFLGFIPERIITSELSVDETVDIIMDDIIAKEID